MKIDHTIISFRRGVRRGVCVLRIWSYKSQLSSEFVNIKETSIHSMLGYTKHLNCYCVIFYLPDEYMLHKFIDENYN